MNKIDMIGKRYGKLLVLKESEPYCAKDRKRITWLCQCDCGNTISVWGESLRSGHTSSCGCLNKEINSVRMVKHNKTNTRLFNIWQGMRSRCYNKNDLNSYPRYGGRGIKMCGKWKNDFQTFYEWSMENGYSDDLSIDRIDNGGDYEPGNCRWVSSFVQSRNKRNNRFYTCDGKTLCLTDWSKESGIEFYCLRARLNRGWDIKKAITVPVRKTKQMQQEVIK